MALLSLHEIQLSFGGPDILDRVSFSVESGERVCLVGRNGAGKSSLLKVISGELTPDSGRIAAGQGLRIASLSQEVPHRLSGTVFEAVLAGLGDQAALLAEYHAVSNRLAHEHDESLLAELERIQHRIEAGGGWEIHRRIGTVLSHLGLDADAFVSDLSGGFKRRVLLASALVNKPDILLLDEPTNHLDIDSIEWLEQFLKEYRGALLFITHDRRFLRSLATRILELDRGAITDWPGDYETYLKRRQAELDAEETRNALFDKKLAQEEVWIRKGIKARRTRNEGRVTALKEMRRQRRERRELDGSVTMRLNEAERSGKLVLEAQHITKKYDDRVIIDDFSTVIMRGDKIGIIGPNGVGKTTLLKMLLGDLAPDSGAVRMGTRLEVAYFDQHRMILDDEKSVADNVAEGTEHITVNGVTRHVIGYLSDFLFPPERSRLPVKVLSGGERNRALLAKLFTQPANVLVMDEPTNDLDSDTLELLEEILADFQGTVLLVSHDREFLDNIVTSTIAFEGNGTLKEYVGGYDDWLRQQGQTAEPAQQKTGNAEIKRPHRERPRVLTYNEKKELEALPARIEGLEAERSRLYDAMADPEFYRKDPANLTTAASRIEELDREIPSAYERWEFLESIPKERG